MNTSKATVSADFQSDRITRDSAFTENRSSSRTKKILIPLDFSPNSEKVLNYGVRLAEQTKSKALLLHVFEYPEFSGFLPEPSTWQMDYAEIKKAFDGAIEKAKQRLAFLANTAREAHVDVGIQICQGTPYEEIVQVAKEEEVDLIVIATHGYTGLKHFLLGSTAERVVRTAPCPVLVVRQKEREFAF